MKPCCYWLSLYRSVSSCCAKSLDIRNECISLLTENLDVGSLGFFSVTKPKWWNSRSVCCSSWVAEEVRVYQIPNWVIARLKINLIVWVRVRDFWTHFRYASKI